MFAPFKRHGVQIEPYITPTVLILFVGPDAPHSHIGVGLVGVVVGRPEGGTAHVTHFLPVVLVVYGGGGKGERVRLLACVCV